MADDKEFDIGIKVTADTTGAEQASEAISGVGDSAREASEGVAGAGEALEESEGAMEGARETAMELGHGFHSR